LRALRLSTTFLLRHSKTFGLKTRSFANEKFGNGLGFDPCVCGVFLGSLYRSFGGAMNINEVAEKHRKIRKEKYALALKLIKDEKLTITEAKERAKIPDCTWMKMRREFGEPDWLTSTKQQYGMVELSEKDKDKRKALWLQLNSLVRPGMPYIAAIKKMGISKPTIQKMIFEFGEITKPKDPDWAFVATRAKKNVFGIFPCLKKCGQSVKVNGELCKFCYSNELREIAGLKRVERVELSIDSTMMEIIYYGERLEIVR
jgi:hypothetical protein